MDIFSEIIMDHQEAKALLKELTEKPTLSAAKKLELFNTLKKDLAIHNEAEERAFYSKINASRKARLLIYEGYDEHRLTHQLLEELASMSYNSEEWIAKVRVLKDLVDHHVEVEEGEIHPEARRTFGQEEALSIGDEFLALKRELIDRLSGAA